MGMNIRRTAGNWEELRDNSNIFPAPVPLMTERREKYSFSFGDTELVQIALPDIFIVYGDIMFKDRLLHFCITDNPDVVEFHFVLSGDGFVNNSIYQIN